MHWVVCSCPACLIVGSRIGPGAARWMLEAFKYPKKKSRNRIKEELYFAVKINMPHFQS